MKDVIGALIELSLACALVAAIFSIAEWVGVLRFARWAFGVGPVVLKGRRKMPVPPAEPDHTFGTKKGQFCLVKPSAADLRRGDYVAVCLFRPRSRGLSVLDVLAVAGVLRWTEGSDDAEVEGRVPLSSMIFLVFWAIGWAASGYYVGFTGGDPWAAWGIAGAAPATVLGAWLLSQIEANRANRVLDELEAGLAEIGLKARD